MKRAVWKVRMARMVWYFGKGAYWFAARIADVIGYRYPSKVFDQIGDKLMDKSAYYLSEAYWDIEDEEQS